MSIAPFELMLIASTLLEFNPLLQALKIIRKKEARDVSLSTFIMILCIGAMWFIYGIQIHSLPLIIGNSIKLFASVCVIIVYSIYARKQHITPNT